jgi:hypothetical protein
VSIEEIEARLRRVVADALQPVQQALARLEAATAPSPPDGSSPVRLLRERQRPGHGRDRLASSVPSSAAEWVPA